MGLPCCHLLPTFRIPPQVFFCQANSVHYLHDNSSELRLQAVEKAIGALEEGGLLCIVTPDSCHQARNSEQLSSWKLGLGLLGVAKVTYTKAKHFHGLVYRKPSCFQMELVKLEAMEGIG